MDLIFHVTQTIKARSEYFLDDGPRMCANIAGVTLTLTLHKTEDFDVSSV